MPLAVSISFVRIFNNILLHDETIRRAESQRMAKKGDSPKCRLMTPAGIRQGDSKAVCGNEVGFIMNHNAFHMGNLFPDALLQILR